MEDTVVEVSCEKCNILLEIKASEYEKAMRDEQPILCDACSALLLDEQEQANKPQRKCFEYLMIDVCEFINEKKYGKEGWELIQIINDKAYFKRELLGETG